MFPYLKHIKTSDHNFNSAIDELVKQILCIRNVIRVVFFVEAEDNKAYLERLAVCQEKIGKQFLFSLIAQKPLLDNVSVECEVSFLNENQFDSIERHCVDECNYIVAKKGIQKAVFATMITEDLTFSVQKQSERIFSCLGKILECENMPINSIVRQWNYIERITDVDDYGQRYQQFNDARSNFYAQTNWTLGYPAATGIGVSSGGVIVEINAVQNAILKPIDNALQVPAHKYSDAVLKCGNEKVVSSPKFERAKLQDNEFLYISGTAAIRGEKNIDKTAKEQTQITLENIDDLLHSATMKTENLMFLRVYVKNSSDFFAVKQVTDTLPQKIEVIFTQSDICRSELLVEIEGIAQK